jgi:chromate reductase, NAD(P)H dehydrogenase (quinone)
LSVVVFSHLALAVEGSMQTGISPFLVIGIAGSLRTRSFNRGLLRAAKDVAPDGMQITITDVAPIPFYNADVEAQGDPAPVAQMKAAVHQADALLIAVSKYNYGISDVLKNTIAWLSRPPQLVLKDKPVALMGASPGMTGTTRAQLQLRQTFVYTQSPVMPPPPEVLVAYAQEKFDAGGQLTDKDTRARIQRLLEALVTWAHLVQPRPEPQLV